MNNMYKLLPPASRKLRFALTLFTLLVVTGISNKLAAQQPGAVGTNGFTGGFNCTALTDLGAFRQARIQATASGTGTWEFPLDCSYPGDIWRPYGGGTAAVTYNTQIAPVGGTGSALYNSGNGGASGNASSIVSGRYYTFNIQEVTSPANANMAILETTYNPKSILAVANSAAINGVATTVGITLSATPSAGENVFVRYSTDGFATSTLALATFSGTTGAATIPAFTTGTTVQYYVLSSPVTPTHTTADMLTLNLNNNGGTNYSYIVSSNPVTVSSSGGTLTASYASLASAVTAINSGTHTGTIVVQVVAGYTENLTARINLTATGTLANPILIQKGGTGVNPKLVAYVGTSTPGSAAPDGMFSLQGSDFVTIDGIDLQDNNITNPATMEYGFGLFKNSVTDGCQFDLIKNCTITLSIVNNAAGTSPMVDGSVGIAVMNSLPTAATTALVPTAASGSNSSNAFYTNTIKNCNVGMALIGYAAPSPYTLADIGNDVGGASAATGNQILNFGGGAATNPSAGIRTLAQYTLNVSYNTVNNNNGTGVNHATTLRGIYLNTAAGASETITNNTITLSSGATTSQLAAIENVAGSTAASNTVSINNNTITTTYTTATSGVTYGIYNNAGAPTTMNINANTLNLSTAATSGSLYAIYNTGAVVTTLNTNNNNITGVTMTGASTSLGFKGIYISSGSSTLNWTASTNNITGVSFTGTGTPTGEWDFIYNTNTILTENVSFNTITNCTFATTGTTYLINLSNNTNGPLNVNNNSIVTGFTKNNSGSSTFFGIYNFGSPTGGTINVNDNNFSNITLFSSSGSTIGSSTGQYGIFWLTNSGPNQSFYNNTVTNVTENGTGMFHAMAFAYGATNNFYNNTVSGISSAGTVVGAYVGNSTSVVMNAYSNNIGTLSSSGASSAIYGIYIGGGTTTSVYSNNINTLTGTGATSPVIHGIYISAGTTVNVYKNKMYNLAENGTISTTSPAVNGITIAAGTTGNVYNNLIGDLKTPAASLTDAIRGINITSVATSSTYNVYYNTVYINATSSGANFGSSGIFHTTSTTSTTATLNLRNNVIINTSTPNGTGLTVAYRRSSGAASALANYASSSNNNVFYAGTPGASRLIYSDGTSSAQAMTNYKTGVFTAGTIAPRDAASVSENPTWQSTSGASVDFLKYNTVIATQLESGGAPIAGITDDYAGTTRNVSTPDMGAWELSGTPADFTGPTITYSLIPNTVVVPTLAVGSVTISDVSGVNGTLGTRPRIYYRLSTNTNAFNDNTSGTDGWKFVEANGSTSPFDFTMDFSKLFGGAGIASGNTIQYFIVAQDNATTPNISINTGTFAASPTSVALTGAAFPIGGSLNSFNVVGTISGVKTICSSGCDYTSLTNAAGAFADINNKVVNGNITLNIQGDLTSELGTNALNEFASPYTITIQPNGGSARVVSGAVASGALIKLNGADRVTINGLNTGGNALTITNSSTTSPTAISIVSLGTGAGATNNTVTNCSISTGVSSATGYGVSIGGSTPGTAGADNDNNTVSNNTITVATTSIYSNGTASVSTGGNDNLTISGNNLNSNSTLQNYGIEVANGLNSTISQNTISVTTSGAVQPVAISLETGFVSSSVSKNTITNVLATNTGGYAGRGITVGTGTATSNLTISNNMIYGVNGSNWSGFSNSSAIGIAIGIIGGSTTLSSTAGGINLYYNTISMTGSMGTASTAAITTALYVGTGASALDIRDNIFSNTQVATSTTQKNFAIYSDATSAAFTNINYNDYFCSNSFNAPSAILGNIGATDRTTLAAIVTGFGGNGNSLNTVANFISATNLHLNTGTSSALDNFGVTIAGITTDYDGDTRSATPDMGMDEFTNVACVTPPVGGTITGPTTAFVGVATPGYSASGFSGTTYQWQTATAIGGPYTDIAGATTSSTSITFATSGNNYVRFKAMNPGCPDGFSNIITVVTTLQGDAACDAITLTFGTNGPYSTTAATTQVGEVVPAGGGCSLDLNWCNTTLSNSLWFKFTAPASGRVSLQSPTFDTQLALWSASDCSNFATFTLLAANDDDVNYTTHGGVQYSSYFTASCLTPGSTYYVQLDPYSSPGASTTVVLTNLGSANATFTGLAGSYCSTAGVVTLTPTVPGGTFSGPGVTGSTFNPATAGTGLVSVTYTLPAPDMCYSTTQSTTITAATTYYADLDGDGFGNPASTTATCAGVPLGYVANNSDCNDALVTYTDADGDGFGVLPKTACGSVTNTSDCNDALVTYTDADGDGFGVLPKTACGSVTNNTDCNDASFTYADADGDGFGFGPAIPCGAVTNNSDCNDALVTYTDADGDGFGVLPKTACGSVTNTSDCNDALVTYTDADGDGFGVLPKTACGSVTNNTDCNDASFTYADADGDGFGFGPAIPCGAVTNNSDCNDAAFTYVDADGDGFGFGSAVACGAVTNNSDCNDALVTYTDADGDGFGVMPMTACGSVTNTSDCDDANILYADTDGDGYGAGSPVACGVLTNTDCAPSNSAINPGEAEVCNGIDDNCAGGIDDGLTFVTYYADADGDLYGNPAVSTTTCSGAPAGYVSNNTDCDDTNAAINPFTLWAYDPDGDGYYSASAITCVSPGAGYVYTGIIGFGDCDDTNPAIHWGATEICNGIDDDCDGTTDDGLTFITYYADADGDGFGNAAVNTTTCSGAPAGYVSNSTDCNDALITYGDADGDGFGFGTMTACGVANNSDCNDALITYTDADGDGFGTTPMIPCGSVTNNTDCNDAAFTYVDADGDGFGFGSAVGCGAVTNNSDCNDALVTYTDADGDGFGVLPKIPCGSVTNNTDCDDANILYADTDGDGYGAGSPVACGVLTNTDCAPSNAAINPGAAEVCNAIDDDCDGVADDGLTFTTYYADTDGDTYGDAFNTTTSCGAIPVGYVANNTDCDDTEASVHPGGIEVCDGLDNDCDGDFDEGTVTAVISPAGSVTACKGVGIILTANPGVGYTYQWFKNGNVILGATTNTYNANKPGNYQVQVNIPAGCFALSNATTVSLNPAPNANASAPNGTTLCTTVKLKASYDASYTWQWKKDGVNIPSATAYIYYPTTAGSYTCVITNTFGCSRTTAAIVVTACKGGDVTESAPKEIFDLYPNPTENEFSVEMEVISDATEATIHLFNMVGEEVYTQTTGINNGTIDAHIVLGDVVPSGLYIVKVTVAEKEYTKQLVIQK